MHSGRALSICKPNALSICTPNLLSPSVNAMLIVSEKERAREREREQEREVLGCRRTNPHKHVAKLQEPFSAARASTAVQSTRSDVVDSSISDSATVYFAGWGGGAGGGAAEHYSRDKEGNQEIETSVGQASAECKELGSGLTHASPGAAAHLIFQTPTHGCGCIYTCNLICMNISYNMRIETYIIICIYLYNVHT